MKKKNVQFNELGIKSNSGAHPRTYPRPFKQHVVGESLCTRVINQEELSQRPCEIHPLTRRMNSSLCSLDPSSLPGNNCNAATSSDSAPGTGNLAGIRDSREPPTKCEKTVKRHEVELSQCSKSRFSLQLNDRETSLVTDYARLNDLNAIKFEAMS